jgi:hypothetical protein
MREGLRQVFFALIWAGFVWGADEPPKVPQYQKVEVSKSVFGDFSMMVQERDEYATNLTKLALLTIHEFAEEPEKLNEHMLTIQREIALALNLSPRNRLAVISNHQLGRGLLPPKPELDYSQKVFARLLLTRGQLLKKKDGASDRLAGSFFVELSAILDPRNEDAIYEYEMQKIDGDAVDWSSLLSES